MAGTMRCLLVIILTLLISVVSGVIETSSVKGVPRLNNPLYCDYYFTCHTRGETLQWIVGNNILSKYFGNSTTGSVVVGPISNCNFTATLLSLQPLSFSRSFISALILSCRSNFNMSINCSDGFLNKTINIPEKDLNLRAENYINLVYLEHVWSQNLVNENNSTCTNIFVCGVNGQFMDVQLGDGMFGFSVFDPIGMERNEVQGTSVEQQAILVDKQPYNLVVAMFLVDSEIMNVTCGTSSNIIFLSSMECSVMPERTSTTGSESSTVGGSSTMASEDIPVILVISIIFGGLLAVAVAAIVIIAIACCCYKRSKEKQKLGAPLNSNKFGGIIKPKKKINGIDYKGFFNQVQYIFLTRNKIVFDAATTIVTEPHIERTINNQLTSIDEGVYIGMIGSHPVCLVNETKKEFLKKLKNVIKNNFSNAKYLIFVGRCFGTDYTLKLADIVISNSIRYSPERYVDTEVIAPEIRSKFCFYPDEIEGLKVTKGNRKAKHLVSQIASGENILGDLILRNFVLGNCDGISGCDETSGKLISLYKNGIDMGNNNTKKMQVITIGAVTGYVHGDNVEEYDEWQFVASQAAFHYVASKMKHPHSSGNISYEIKKPKPMTGNVDNSLARSVKYIILTLSPDDFDAITTRICAPESKEDIIEIAKNVSIGRIGSHSVGLMYLSYPRDYYADMKNAIVNHFPCAEYLIHVGGSFGVDKNEVKLGDVLISKEIFSIAYDGQSYNCKSIKLYSEIPNIFGNSYDVQGLQLPGNRRAKHFEVRIATGTGAGINTNVNMKHIAIKTIGNYGYNEVGGELLLLKKDMKDDGRQINFILITGVCGYAYSRDCIEWNFVATQAAIDYVAAKMQYAN